MRALRTIGIGIVAWVLCAACVENRAVYPLLYTAVRNNNYAEVLYAIQDPGSLNWTDENGRTPLIVASYYSYYPTMKALIDKGAKLDIQDNKGNTALLYSVYYGNILGAKYLIEHGADYNIRNQAGYTALIYARYYEHDELVKILKEKGAVE